jgi:hypothetical protein
MKENLTHLIVSIATTTSTAFLLILATASAALGLIPSPGEYCPDGFIFARWVFNETGHVIFEPTPNWSYRGSVGELPRPGEAPSGGPIGGN